MTLSKRSKVGTANAVPTVARRRPGGWFRYASLLPAVAFLVLLTGIPVFTLMRMAASTIEFTSSGPIYSFSLMENLARLRSDWLFVVNMRTTILFVVVSVALEMVLGFLLAVMVAGVRRGKGLLRTVMILPILLPPVAIGAMFKLVYNYDFGILNEALVLIGLDRVQWLSNADIALWSVVFVDVWHWTPLVFLILFAGVVGLPKDVIEAARVDGATTRQIILRIILPLMMPAIAVAFVLRSIMAFKVFDQIFLLTSGGPGTSTEVVSLRLYDVFFNQNEMGYGALLAVVVIAAVMVFLITAGGLARRIGQ